jgi:hypothetical protein
MRAVLCHVLYLCPSERAFSILNGCLDDGQHNAFADYKEAMVMAQYNAPGRQLVKVEMGRTEKRALPSYSGAWGGISLCV